jgi:hypothetical protein
MANSPLLTSKQDSFIKQEKSAPGSPVKPQWSKSPSLSNRGHHVSHSSSCEYALEAKDEKLVTVIFPVANSLVGSILGPGGRILEDIQRSSSTRIVLSKHESFSKQRFLNIRGSNGAVQVARMIIESKIGASKLKNEETDDWYSKCQSDSESFTLFPLRYERGFRNVDQPLTQEENMEWSPFANLHELDSEP